MTRAITTDAARVIDTLEQQDLDEEHAQLTKSQRLVRCVSRPAAELLHTLVLINRPSMILELGTSLGYSTIWIATAARRVGARVVTVEGDARKIPHARQNLKEAGVSSLVTTVPGEVPEALDELPGTYGFIFVDLTSSLYAEVFRRMRSRMDPGGLFFFDGVGTFGNWQTDNSLCELRSAVDNADDYESLLMPLEKGYLLAIQVNDAPGRTLPR